MALDRIYKPECLNQAVEITKAFAVSAESAKVRLDDVVEALYKKICDLREDAEKAS